MTVFNKDLSANLNSITYTKVLTKVVLFLYTLKAMDIQQFNSKIISITQLRRDIDALEKVLEKEEEAVVMRNQDVLFVAMTPKRYKEIFPGISRKERIATAVAAIEKIRISHGKTKGPLQASEYVVRMRDERINRWNP